MTPSGNRPAGVSPFLFSPSNPRLKCGAALWHEPRQEERSPGHRRFFPGPEIGVGKKGLSPTVAAEPPLSATPDAGLGTVRSLRGAGSRCAAAVGLPCPGWGVGGLSLPAESWEKGL